MGAHSHTNQDKVRMTIECTPEERVYIKILAAKAHLNLSELVLSYLRKDFPCTPNKETLAAMKELDEGGGMVYKSMDDFWENMGVKPSARS
ncbi:hypothetical protein [Neochlamydia sp. S13]|uniref:hypothetical protein n=1 Tax=Neochlamydia sp. S13 TaxID=1353976 RepID=UPI0005A9B8B3|nr:hypothetical protein [Neochlamydia sp. S13]BBI16274.1 Putative uncharacterized protein [Neochlamydia sp. S13]